MISDIILPLISQESLSMTGALCLFGALVAFATNPVSLLFSGGVCKEVKEKTDASAFSRGVVWTIVGTAMILVSLSELPSGISCKLTGFNFRLFPDLFILIAIIMSVFYGAIAERVFGNKEARKKNHEEFRIWGHLNQFWLNFVGAAFGWFSLYIFINILGKVRLSELSFVHTLFFIFGVLGIVGWLPMTLQNIITAASAAMKRLIDKI